MNAAPSANDRRIASCAARVDRARQTLQDHEIALQLARIELRAAAAALDKAVALGQDEADVRLDQLARAIG